MRRSGKSYLLFTLFSNYLSQQGVDEQHIVKIDLESIYNESLRDPHQILDYIKQRLTDHQDYFVLIAPSTEAPFE